jgi:lysophospholipid acyltransferase (LPLAT)-like uncharacterized protein
VQKKLSKRVIGFLTGWLAAAIVLSLRWSCRIRWHNDPRAVLRAAGHNHVFCVLHAHQVMATIDAEPGTGAMVSQSADGDMIARALQVRGIKVLRGSNANGRGDRGGRAALAALQQHVAAGSPACMAADGPRGPRGRVHKGIAHLAQQTGAAIIVVVPHASRRWILSRTWDRMQIPKPFSRIDGHCGIPMFAQPGERLEHFRARIEAAILALEQQIDPEEAKYNHKPPARMLAA